MNNLTFGNRRFTYYETIGGGQGGSARHRGASGVHVAMSNALNTPVEALELAYPLRVRRYELRRGSGGGGARPGGDGVVREIEALEHCRISVLAERRARSPAGARGGEPGLPAGPCSTAPSSRRRSPGRSSPATSCGSRPPGAAGTGVRPERSYDRPSHASEIDGGGTVAGYTIKHLDELEHPWPKWRLARRSLEVSAFGMNVAELQPGEAIPEHDEVERDQEEVFLTLSGSPSIVIDGTSHPLPAGAFARLDPQPARTVVNDGADLAQVLIISAPRTSGYEPLDWA